MACFFPPLTAVAVARAASCGTQRASPVNAHMSTCQSDGADLSHANLSCPGVYTMQSFMLLAVAALRLPSGMVSRRDAIAAAAATASAATIIWPAGAHAASSLTDSEGRYVVDPKKAADGLEDPLVETEGAYSTISAALAVAPSGSTVLVKPGEYNERVIITKPLQLIADPGSVLTWRSDKPYEAALMVDLSKSSAASVGDRVLVSGLTIRHFSPSIAQNYGVYVPPPSVAADRNTKIELRDCDVSSGSGSGVGVEGGDVTLASCKVTACKNHGVSYLGPNARGAVVGCTVEKCKLNGVLLRDGAAPTLSANRLLSNGQYGAALFDCRGTFEADNKATGNGKGAVSGECDADDG